MVEIPYTLSFRKQNDKSVPATFKKGIIVAVYTESATADVTLIGSQQTVLRNVYLSSAVDLADVLVGDRCRVDMFDETNPNDCVVAYIYGRRKAM